MSVREGRWCGDGESGDVRRREKGRSRVREARRGGKKEGSEGKRKEVGLAADTLIEGMRESLSIFAFVTHRIRDPALVRAVTSKEASRKSWGKKKALSIAGILLSLGSSRKLTSWPRENRVHRRLNIL